MKRLAEEELTAGSGVRVNSACPGYCATDMSSHGGHRTAEQGARTPAWLALTSVEDERTGGFFYDNEELNWEGGQTGW